jgi:flagellar motor protein MotB
MNKVVKQLLLSCTVAALCACAHKPIDPPPAVRLAMSQTDRGVMIWLPDNVLFAFGKSDLSPEAGPYLDRVAQILNSKTDHQLSLEGHTDNMGAVELNQRLSEKRAETVLVALRERAVLPSRLKALGFGLTKPLAPNDSDLGRRLNRRVELIVLDEKVETLTRGEPANAFEDAFARLKSQLDTDLNPPGAGPAATAASSPVSPAKAEAGK